MEVWIQKHQVYCQVPFCRKAASNRLDEIRSARVRLLLQRESRGESPALEPGTRAENRRIYQAQDADVQRLWRPDRFSLSGDGSQNQFLILNVEFSIQNSKFKIQNFAGGRLPCLPDPFRPARIRRLHR